MELKKRARRRENEGEERIDIGDPLLSETDGNDDSTAENIKFQKDSSLFVSPQERRRQFLISTGILCSLMLITLFVKLHNVDSPSSVVFDEVHFGKFAGLYINRTYFFDVHPPLGKMLFAGVAYLSGFDAKYGFENIGERIPPNVPYYQMRLFSAFCGAMLVPLAYLTLRTCGCSHISALFASIMILFDNGYSLQSKFIFLDGSMLLFLSLSTLFWTRFQKVKSKPFTMPWFLDLFFTGIFIAFTSCVKSVGLLVTAWVGTSTIKDLWDLLCDRTVGVNLFMKHFFSRAICLIAVPLSIYLLAFYIHFLILTKTGPGDHNMSPQFQRSLIGHFEATMTAEVGTGSEIKLKQVSSENNFLHSHVQTYPMGSRQQQVTCSPIEDLNSKFIIFHANEKMEQGGYIPLRNGMVIRIFHRNTKGFLRVEDVPAPLSTEDKEVSATKETESEANQWRVVIAKNGEMKDVVRIFETEFFLVNLKYDCGLVAHNKVLPEWGFRQIEVTCGKDYKANPKDYLWAVHENSNENALTNDTFVDPIPMPFQKKFIEIHKVITEIHGRLNSPHPYMSSPPSWPLLERGVFYWTDNGKSVYMLGNPMVWWPALICLIIFIFIALILALRAKRGYQDQSLEPMKELQQYSYLFFLGYLWNYVPYFFFKRQLFLHHYLPALYFNILICGIVFEFLTSLIVLALSRIPFLRLIGLIYLRWHPQSIHIMLFISFAITAIWGYSKFLPFQDGLEMEKDYCENLKWRLTWDFDCWGIQ